MVRPVVESDGTGGWFIHQVDNLNASIHLTEAWLDEFEEHQGSQPRLRWLLKRGSNPTDIGDAVQGALDRARRPSRKGNPRSPELRERMKERRANRK